MRNSSLHVLCGWLLAGLVLAPAAALEGHLMRMADVHEDQIVFTYEDDLWLVSTEGGLARRLTNDPGQEVWAKFSPDGKWLAFTAQYDGGLDVYLMPSQGGIPTRLTYHPAMDRVLGWFPDGKHVLFRSTRVWPNRGEEVYKVSIDGGMPERLPVDRAGLASISPDGKSIAYNRISRESRTWKRHRGGTAQDIWMGSFEDTDYRKVVDSDWTENFPMWHGDAIYFNSDREDGTLNLYKYEVSSQRITRLTRYKDYDVKYPAIGPNHIVYQYRETLHLYDLRSNVTQEVPVEIPSDMVAVRPEFDRISPTAGAFQLSPTGVRLLLEARGEIINVPVEKGQPVNLTKAPGSREKNCAWSPDGRWIAFLSDKTGEEEVYLVDQHGEKEWKQLTTGGLGFRMQLVWSPDSKYLAFSDKFMRLNVVNAETGEITVADQSHYDDAWERWGIQEYAWSPCSQWLVYSKMEKTMYESIFVYSLADGQAHRLTGEMTQDWSPSFSPCGKYLYFLSNRTFDPKMGYVDQNHIYRDLTRPYILLLAADAESPYKPETSEEEVKEEAPSAEQKKEEAGAAEEKEEAAEAADASAGDAQPEPPEKKDDKDQKDEKHARIDLEGIEWRILPAQGVSAGNYFRLEATEKGFLYLSNPDPGFSKYDIINDHTGGGLELYHYDLKEAETSKVMDGIANYHLSPNGKKMVYRAGGTYGVVDTGKKGKVGDGKVDYGSVRITVDRGQEFFQIFDEAWRIQRDWFYDENMHGLNWPEIREKYRQFVPYAGNRSDLNYLIGEMIAELNIGHTYVWGGDAQGGGKYVPTGFLGADFEVVAGSPYYRIKHIVPQYPLVPDERSPLAEPGSPIKVGHYLIALDGEEITTSDNIYRFLQNRQSSVVRITYNDEPTKEGAREFLTRTIGSEGAIRYREWVEKNRAYVDELTDGQVGYVHLPDMGEDGLREFARYWYPQYYKKGFIVDARYNGGGFTADMIIDRLEREIWGITIPREGKGWRDPERVFVGPWALLINEDTGSNGEMFAEAIKIKNMAPVIGMRTWGGSIGIEPHQPLVDGGTVTPPQFGLYGLDRRWLIEGRGVEPNIEVQNTPGNVLRGIDEQLDAGIQNVMQRIPAEGFEMPPVPAYPDKSRPHGS